MRLDTKSVEKRLHILDMFLGITCGGLRTVVEAGYKVSCYTSIEIGEVSRAIGRKMLSDLQFEYPGKLPDKAIRGYNKRLPQKNQLVKENDLVSLVQFNGPVNFICGGWECQSMSLAGFQKGMEDERFLPFLDMIKISISFQVEQHQSPLYLFENTWPGHPGQYP